MVNTWNKYKFQSIHPPSYPPGSQCRLQALAPTACLSSCLVYPLTFLENNHFKCIIVEVLGKSTSDKVSIQAIASSSSSLSSSFSSPCVPVHTFREQSFSGHNFGINKPQGGGCCESLLDLKAGMCEFPGELHPWKELVPPEWCNTQRLMSKLCRN